MGGNSPYDGDILLYVLGGMMGYRNHRVCIAFRVAVLCAVSALFFEVMPSKAHAATCANSGTGTAYVTGVSLDAGQIVTISSSSGYVRYAFQAPGAFTYTFSTAPITLTVPSTGTYDIRAYDVTSGNVLTWAGTTTVTCAAAPAATTAPSDTRGATQALSTQLASSLPQAQIGNIARRIEIAPPSIPTSSNNRNVPSGSGTQQANSFSQSALGGGMGSFGLSDGRAFSLMDDDAAYRLARGEDDRRSNPLQQLAALGNFTHTLSASSPQGDTPTDAARRRIQAAVTESPLTIWGQGSVSDVKNSLRAGRTDNRYSGRITAYSLGADYRLDESWLAGITAGYATSDIVTTYNSGNYREDSYTLSPYALWRPNDILRVQMVLGASLGTIESDRSNNAVRGETDSRSMFLSTTAIARLPTDDTRLRAEGRLSILAGRRWVDAYRESDGTQNQSSDSTIAQIRPGAELGYEIPVADADIEPFARIEQVWDAGDTVNGDHLAWQGTLGLRGRGGPLFGSVEYDTEFDRSSYSQRTLSGLIGYQFSLRDGAQDANLSPYLSLSSDGLVERTGLGLRYNPNRTMSINASLDRTQITEGANSYLARLRMNAQF